jgi:hypothetical protein
MAILPSLDQAMLVLGYIVLALLIIVLVYTVVLSVLTVVSIRRGRFYSSRLLKPGVILLESFLRGLCRAAGIDDHELTSFAIRLRNQMNQGAFSEVPVDKRAIFLPQCLRSAGCPAALTTEGLVCVRCMRCDIGKHIDELEGEGCKVFIVPGSSFVKRMIKKYRPEAIIGVGCLLEVKEGLEMADSINMAAMGVVTDRDGCVETAVQWEKLFEAVRLKPGDPLTANSLAP